MRKVMHELDRIYFTPLFQRKFKTLIKLKRRRHKLGGKAPGSAASNARRPKAASDATPTPTSPAGADEGESGGAGEGTPTAATAAPPAQPQPQQRKQLARKPIKRLKGGFVQSSDSTDSLTSSQSESCGDQDTSTTTSTSTGVQARRRMAKVSGSGTGTGAASPKKSGNNKKKKKKFMPTEKKKPEVYHKTMVNRNFRLWLANRCIYIYRRKKVAFVPREVKIITNCYLNSLSLSITTFFPSTNLGGNRQGARLAIFTKTHAMYKQSRYP